MPSATSPSGEVRTKFGEMSEKKAEAEEDRGDVVINCEKFVNGLPIVVVVKASAGSAAVRALCWSAVCRSAIC